MQQELTTINTEIAVVRESQQALTTLMEGILTRLDVVPEIEPSPAEFGDSDVDRLAQAWDFNGFGMQKLPMERLATIPEVASIEAEIAPAATAPGMSVFPLWVVYHKSDLKVPHRLLHPHCLQHKAAPW